MNLARPTDPTAPFLSEESRRIPDYLVESAWLEHAPFAAWLVERLRPQTFVELGTHHGFSYAAICEAIARQRLAAACHAIDTWRGDKHAGDFDERVLERFRAYHDPRYSGFSELLQSSFDDALPRFADGSIDLLHLDGQHFYADVSHDFENWLPKMSGRGVILLHDTEVRERGFGVFRLWAEIRDRFPGFNFEHGHGLGVLAVGTGYHPDLARLIDLDGDEATAAAVRTAYAELGADVARAWRERSAAGMHAA
ncbi:MAG TPA: class I SAM-dependent methyltransferase [Bauldia sp.]|nr:class I SAM-dependent methyltransferase [Bauldia sp.]